jgi:hypothetical protein
VDKEKNNFEENEEIKKLNEMPENIKNIVDKYIKNKNENKSNNIIINAYENDINDDSQNS